MNSYHQLTQEERYRITALRMCGCSHAEIARQLQRHPSTIGRELRRNRTTHDAEYRAEKAHSYATRFPLKVYFATPYHSWERGSNENFNGLLRQYLPKGTCMRNVTQARCNQIADDLNHRPRKRHGFKTPAALYHRY